MIAGLLVAAVVAGPLQEPSRQPSTANRTVRFLAGAVLGLAAHESGHLIFDAAFDAHPRFERVSFAGIPFFAITHDSGLPPRQEYMISSAGFLAQHLGSEWLLTRRPGLTDESAPMAKGYLAFNVLCSVGYGTGALLKVGGPSERDTRGMADSLGVDERVVGAVLLAPALLDAYRYRHPRSGWARWSSRVLKVGMVVWVLQAKSGPLH